MCTYLLRDVPPSLWAKVRAHAKAKGMSVRALVIRLLTRCVNGEI